MPRRPHAFAMVAQRAVHEALTGIAMRKAGITGKNYFDPKAIDASKRVPLAN